MSEARVVVDTSSLISFYLGRKSAAHQAIQILRSTHLFLASSETLAEFREVIQREKFSRISMQLRLGFIAEYQQLITLVEPSLLITACRDPKDDKFLSLAVSGHAELILTGDQDLLLLHPFRGIDILAPADFLIRNPR